MTPDPELVARILTKHNDPDHAPCETCIIIAAYQASLSQGGRTMSLPAPGDDDQ